MTLRPQAIQLFTNVRHNQTIIPQKASLITKNTSPLLTPQRRILNQSIQQPNIQQLAPVTSQTSPQLITGQVNNLPQHRCSQQSYPGSQSSAANSGISNPSQEYNSRLSYRQQSELGQPVLLSPIQQVATRSTVKKALSDGRTSSKNHTKSQSTSLKLSKKRDTKKKEILKTPTCKLSIGPKRKPQYAREKPKNLPPDVLLKLMNDDATIYSSEFREDVDEPSSNSKPDYDQCVSSPPSVVSQMLNEKDTHHTMATESHEPIDGISSQVNHHLSQCQGFEMKHGTECSNQTRALTYQHDNQTPSTFQQNSSQKDASQPMHMLDNTKHVNKSTPQPSSTVNQQSHLQLQSQPNPTSLPQVVNQQQPLHTQIAMSGTHPGVQFNSNTITQLPISPQAQYRHLINYRNNPRPYLNNINQYPSPQYNARLPRHMTPRAIIKQNMLPSYIPQLQSTINYPTQSSNQYIAKNSLQLYSNNDEATTRMSNENTIERQENIESTIKPSTTSHDGAKVESCSVSLTSRSSSLLADQKISGAQNVSTKRTNQNYTPPETCSHILKHIPIDSPITTTRRSGQKSGSSSEPVIVARPPLSRPLDAGLGSTPIGFGLYRLISPSTDAIDSDDSMQGDEMNPVNRTMTSTVCWMGNSEENKLVMRDTHIGEINQQVELCSKSQRPGSTMTQVDKAIPGVPLFVPRYIHNTPAMVSKQH